MLHIITFIGVAAAWFLVSNGIGTLFDMLEDWAN